MPIQNESGGREPAKDELPAERRIDKRFAPFMKIIMAVLIAASLTIALKPADVSAAPKVHTVTFLYGTKTFPEPVFHGANAIAPTDTYIEGYTFLGWVGNIYNVTEDRIILGSYAKNEIPGSSGGSHEHVLFAGNFGSAAQYGGCKVRVQKLLKKYGTHRTTIRTAQKNVLGRRY